MAALAIAQRNDAFRMLKRKRMPPILGQACLTSVAPEWASACVLRAWGDTCGARGEPVVSRSIVPDTTRIVSHSGTFRRPSPSSSGLLRAGRPCFGTSAFTRLGSIFPRAYNNARTSNKLAARALSRLLSPQVRGFVVSLDFVAVRSVLLELEVNTGLNQSPVMTALADSSLDMRPDYHSPTRSHVTVVISRPIH